MHGIIKKYMEENGLNELLKDISEVLRLSIKLYRNIEKETLEFIE